VTNDRRPIDTLVDDEIIIDAPVSSRTERLLLVIAGVFILVNFIALTILRPANASLHIVAWTTWAASAFAGHHLLEYYLPRRDTLLFPIIMFLTGWGLVAISRLAPFFAERQMAWLVVSVGGLLLVAALPRTLHWLRNYRYLWLIFGLGLLVSTILLGSHPSGHIGAPQLWLGFGGIYFQPSEALKVILVVFLASYLAEQYPSLRATGQFRRDGSLRALALSPRVFGPILLMWGLSVVVLVWQRDLGMATLFFMVFLVLLYVASGHLLILFSGLILLPLAGFLAYHLFAVVQLRIDIWLNPWPEADGRAYQLVQSFLAFAAGGIFGQGVGQGSPGFIPVVHSDFIFAALAEEWGLLGVVMLLSCFAILIARGMRIATLQTGSPFRALLAVGLSTVIAVQTILILGGVTRLLPLTGITLPFLSYGGSSLLMSFITIGLLLRLSSTED
jgi:cell division protein FtsW (lipid II flippase)